MTYSHIETFLGRGYRLQVGFNSLTDITRPYHAMVVGNGIETAHNYLGTTFERALIGLDLYLGSLTQQHCEPRT